MNLLFIITTLAVAALVAACLWMPSASIREIRRALGTTRILALNALGDGTHLGGKLSLKSDAAITTRHLLAKRGSDANHAAVIAAASDEPLGLLFDEAAAAEAAIGLQLLGVSPGTLVGVAQGTIAADVDVYSYGDGTLTVVPTSAGTFWKVGRSVTASTAGLLIEFEPCVPQKVVVLAALTSSNGTAAGAADLAALKVEAEKIGDDVRALAAALDARAVLKVLT